MTRLTLLLVALSGFLLAGCGQSGPLYIAGDPSEIRQPPPPAETNSEEENDDEESAQDD
jgi:predicted small lipoprotein YifL